MHIRYNIRAGLYLKSAKWRYLDPLLEEIPLTLRDIPDCDAICRKQFDNLIVEVKILRAHLDHHIDRLFSETDNILIKDRFAEIMKDLNLGKIQRMPRYEHVRKRLTSFRAYVRAANCRKCVGEGRHPCEGDPDNDNRNVINGGLCFRWFLHMSRECEDAYVSYCNKVAREFGFAPAQVSVRTMGSDRRRPHGFDHDSHASGEARPETTSAGHHTVITLTLSTHTDQLTLGVIPYIYLHEILCHANQKISPESRPNGAHRRTRALDCEFAEGWLAETSYRLLEHLTPRFDRPSPAIPVLHGVVLSQCRTFHAARTAKGNFERASRYSAVVQDSIKEHLKKFAPHAPDCDNPDHQVAELSYRFAFLINAIATDVEIDRLLHAMRCLIPDKGYIANPGKLQKGIASAIKMFLEKQRKDPQKTAFPYFIGQLEQLDQKLRRA